MRETLEKLLQTTKQIKEVNNLLEHEPLQDSVIILPMDFDEDDTIVNPRQYEDKPEWGIVISVGKGRTLESGEVLVPEVKEGDMVVFGAYASTTVRSHGQDFFFLRAVDILSKYGR